MFLCRTDVLTVSNNLVGRIIGRGGTKINSIQVCSCDHYIDCVVGLN